ncbi:MAG: glycine zipper 2TM domain-containing protein [Parasphingopyxis sp.]
MTAAPALADPADWAPAHGKRAQEAQNFHAPGAEYAMLQRRERHRGYRGRYWRGDDGRYRCRRDDGTVGLLVGGGVGALVGREIDGGRDRTAGTIIGGVVGALVGREIDRSDVECR